LDRRALRVDNEYVDEILMKLPLKADRVALGANGRPIIPGND
jgi:hypothetical protein